MGASFLGVPWSERFSRGFPWACAVMTRHSIPYGQIVCHNVYGIERGRCVWRTIVFRILSPGKVALAVAMLTVLAAWAIVRAGDDPNEDLTDDWDDE